MKWITFALLTALISLHYQIWLHQGGLHKQFAQMSQQAQIMTTQNAQLRMQNNQLRAEVYDLQNGFEAVSEIARNQFGYIQDGELFYTFQP